MGRLLLQLQLLLVARRGPDGSERGDTMAQPGSVRGRVSAERLRSWWEVPAIAHFCSLFRAAFALPDFEIEVRLRIEAADPRPE